MESRVEIPTVGEDEKRIKLSVDVSAILNFN